MQNVDEVLMGTTQSSARSVTNEKGEIEAGIAVRKKSDDTLSILKADGELIGISLGQSLSFNARTAICRKGLRVPLKLTAGFNPTVGAQVHISDTTGLGIAAGAGATGVNATYGAPYEGATGARIGGAGASGGIGEDGLAKGAAFIDFPGGL